MAEEACFSQSIFSSFLFHLHKEMAYQVTVIEILLTGLFNHNTNNQMANMLYQKRKSDSFGKILYFYPV